VLGGLTPTILTSMSVRLIRLLDAVTDATA
jgi:hypothetical protein